MTRAEKLLSKARNNPSGLSFREFEDCFPGADGYLIIRKEATESGIRLRNSAFLSSPDRTEKQKGIR